MTTSKQLADEHFEGWAILELMGHRKLAGQISEVTIGGAPMLRLDTPSAAGDVTQFYSAAAVYCITPCNEKTARAVADAYRPQPVSRFELPVRTERTGDDDEPH